MEIHSLELPPLIQGGRLLLRTPQLRRCKRSCKKSFLTVPPQTYSQGQTTYKLWGLGITEAERAATVMHIISRKRLNEFAEKHPEAQASLARWYYLAKQLNFSSHAQLRQTFPAADRVGKLTVFNVGGNNVRLIAAIHYNRKKIYIRAVLTHAEYDEQRWKE